MPTNDERREVAARLRNLDEEMWGCYSEEYEDLRWACMCNRGEYGGMELKDRLADLIEPEPERTCRMEQSFAEPSRLDFMQEYLCLSCKEYGYMQIAVDGDRLNYCPNCGAKVVEE